VACVWPAAPAGTCSCEDAFFPGLSDNDGGMAEYLRTTARACVKLNPDTNPADVAALADAGITAYHAVRKACRCSTRAPPRWCRVPRLGHMASRRSPR